MNKITYSELAGLFRKHEAENSNKDALMGAIVFTEDSFNKAYPLESRTYIVSSRNKAYMPDMLGYSIFGSCLDGTDQCVRLDGYMKAEHGGKKGWKVDYCYLCEN